jgi:hypothetical protein
MHGGKSRGGDDSPSLKHGWYSQYFLYNYRRSRVQHQMELERRINLGLRKLDIERQAREERAAAQAEEVRKILETVDYSVLSALAAKGDFPFSNPTSEAGTDDVKEFS